MKVTFLANKYECGSCRGLYYYDRPGLLDELREVISLQDSEYPSKWEETEDGKAYHKTKMTEDEFFEGGEHKLEPGHMFVYDGQIFAIDSPERLILEISETGALAVKRFVTEILDQELKLIKGDPEYMTNDVQITEISKLPDELLESEPFSLSYYKEKLWREKTNLPKMFQTIFRSNYSFLPIRLWFDKNHVYYYPDEIDSDIVEDLIQEFLCWTWKNKVDDLLPPTKENK